jgi:diguanylate cyclase
MVSAFMLPWDIAIGFVQKVGLIMVAANLVGVIIVGGMMNARRSQFEIERMLRANTTLDALTQLHNRRYFDDHGPGYVRNALQTYGSFAVLVIDIDNFKAINDTFGHAQGDTVLQKAAERVKAQMSRNDLVARYGGEEIVGLVADCVNIRETAESIRASIGNDAIVLGGIPITVTVSIGYAIVRSDSIGLKEAFENADAALYRAKNGGRNRVELAKAA